MWKKYLDYNLEANEKGQVRNAKTKKLRKPTIMQNGYKVVGLRFNKQQKVLYVHRIVAELFLENPNDYKCVNHIDNNKLNNSIDNLEWCTYKHNTQMAFYKQNAFKKYTCKCCGKELFAMNSRKEDICHICKYQIEKIQRSESKKQRILNKRKEVLNTIKTYVNYEVFNYYEKHKDMFELWEKGESLQKIGKQKNCTKQNVSILVNNLKNLYSTYYQDYSAIM